MRKLRFFRDINNYSKYLKRKKALTTFAKNIYQNYHKSIYQVLPKDIGSLISMSIKSLDYTSALQSTFQNYINTINSYKSLIFSADALVKSMATVTTKSIYDLQRSLPSLINTAELIRKAAADFEKA